ETWSKFRAHTTGMPSSDDRTTSVLSPRIVRVTGATMISFKCSNTSFRVRIKTGRRLSGGRNVYHRISPRLNRPPPNLRHPTKAVPHHWKTPRVSGEMHCTHLFRPVVR